MKKTSGYLYFWGSREEWGDNFLFDTKCCCNYMWYFVDKMDGEEIYVLHIKKNILRIKKNILHIKKNMLLAKKNIFHIKKEYTSYKKEYASNKERLYIM